jgi:hypothetical protein
MDILGLIGFLLILTALATVSYTAIAFGFRNRKLSNEVIQLRLDKLALLNKLEQELSLRENKSIEQTDGFIKFLSESRDWAFTYIEDAQNTIVAVKNDWDNGNQMEESMVKLFALLPENKEK